MAGPRVLVIDDEESVRALWVDALSQAGYAALGVGSAGEVLAWLPDWTPDLILLDMMMPEMDGFEFLARLRRNPGWDHIPILIVSALGEELATSIDEKGTRTLGVCGVLAKPLDVDILLARVQRIVGPSASA